MSFSSSSNSSKEAMLAATTNGGTDGGGGGGGGGDNNDDDSSYIVMKGKRTKRQRSHNSAPPVATTGSSTTTSAGSYTSTTEEEEDMANCLILLAQGPKAQLKSMESGKVGGGVTPKVSSRRYVGPAAAAASKSTEEKVGFYVYECKTCNKRFPSFQALGGHRTSHKKPKLAAATVAGGGSTTEGKKSMEEDFNLQISIASFPKPIVVANNNGNGGNKTRVHECSICGSEFSSGQALGGHMRRHRPVVVPTAGSSLEPKKEKSLLSLDLNLPAPSDEDREDFVKSPLTSSATTFPFGTGEPSVLFSALVDCHY